MSSYAELIIALSKQQDGDYSVRLSFDRPDDNDLRTPESGPARFDFVKLRQETQNPAAYGRLLKDSLFGDNAGANVREFMKQCLAVTKQAHQPIRMRVLVDRSAPELHDLRWEALSSLDGNEFLAIDQERLLSRFLASSDWSRTELRSKKALRALVVIANPNQLKKGIKIPGGRELAEVDVAGELKHAQDGLQGIHIDELVSKEGEPGQATLLNLEQKLEEGYDFLYLICHGALFAEDPKVPNSPKRALLWLEGADGSVDRVNGQELVEIIGHLPSAKRPRMIVLASCQSSGKGQVPGEEQSADQGALAALGPRLAQAGVPAVIAMQDNVKMATVAQFMPVFFEELLKDGWVDRAMMEARWAVRKHIDWWAPVLFLRLRGGRLWYDPGFARTDQNLWTGISNAIQQQKCVPIIGSELLNSLTGPASEIARKWALKHHFPLAEHDRDDFPRVAQYLSIEMNRAFPRDQLLTHFKESLIEQFSESLPADAQYWTLPEVLTHLGQQMPIEAYNVLASLPFPIYINANPDNLLEDALRAQDPAKEPQVMYFHWKQELIMNTLQTNGKPEEPKPTVRKPLVYHLFGHVEEPKSLVLTEDDYFEYLMWINKSNHPIPVPQRVLRAWREQALLFLGFQLRDWNFRVLFRSIFNEERRQLGRDYRSVAAQLQPGDNNLRPELACRYLEKYFPSDKFDIYWGSTDDFLEELLKQM